MVKTNAWDNLPDLTKYRILLNRITYPVLLNHPMKEQLKECTDLHRKVGLLEQIFFGGNDG